MSGFRNLRDIQREWPSYGFDFAAEDFFVLVEEAESVHYVQGDPLSCGIAQAIRRTHPFLTPYIFDTVAYIANHKIRMITKYMLGSVETRKLQAFEDSEDKVIEPGLYVLRAPKPYQQEKVTGKITPGTGKSGRNMKEARTYRHVERTDAA